MTKRDRHNHTIAYNHTGAATSQSGLVRYVMIVALVTICAVLFWSVKSHAFADTVEIKSGISGYCLDVHSNGATAGTVADSWRCNDTDAQDWRVIGVSIEHGNNLCLSVANNAIAGGSSVVLGPCDEAAGQVWLRDKSGYQNPNSGLCLAVPSAQTDKQLVLADCARLSDPGETWAPKTQAGTQESPVCSGTEPQKVTCYAEQDWSQWQTGSPSHETLLTYYTDGAPYEEWCADFVSYVYKQAGHPFTHGETNRWDENVAGRIQYMGFTKHDAAGYTPRPGDIAYFDYPGGHVEIVVSGGHKPTFIYGNSAKVDPATGNGEMEANTITNTAYGRVIYYLSPDR